MVERLKERLLEATEKFSAAGEASRLASRLRKKPSFVTSPRYLSRRASIQDEKPDVAGNGSPELRRRFLFRLAVALHAYGSSASRTEYLIERAAERLGVDTNIVCFPTLILLSFGEASEEPSGTEFHLLTVESELDIGKLGRADELANKVGKREAPLVLAYWRLKAIATAPQEFGTWWRLFSYALSASMASPLFFNGNLWDAGFCFLLGLVIGAMDIFASSSPLFSSVMEFIAAIFVSFTSRLLSIYLKKLNICVSSLALPALVELLPGMPLALGVSEMVARSHVTGTARIIYGLFSALQLGFGLIIGDISTWWSPTSRHTECVPPSLSKWWNILWLAGYITASNILLNARLSQWPGMALAASMGYLVSFTTDKLGSSASTMLAAFAVGITGSFYSQLTGELPLAMTLSGVLLLVPGGLGVEGIAAMFDKEVSSGMAFVFDMLVVALSITIGLLIAKIFGGILLGAKHFQGRAAHNKSTLAAHLEDDASDVEREEHMAI